jgi:hypothetical protein
MAGTVVEELGEAIEELVGVVERLDDATALVFRDILREMRVPPEVVCAESAAARTDKANTS